jgi:hypothetical protein
MVTKEQGKLVGEASMRAALKMAIEALELINEHAFRCGLAQDAIKACKEALEQPAQEWVGLSDADVMQITWGLEHIKDKDIFTSDFAKAIEAKLKKLNVPEKG